MPPSRTITVGVVSDTHGLLRPELLREVQGSDLIVHAGDVGDLSILDELRAIAPVWAVRGNTDRGEVAAALPLTEAVEIRPPGESGDVEGEALLLYLLHGHLPLDLVPQAAGVRIVVSGHTHMPAIREEAGVLYLNPGSVGPRRFSTPVSLARVTIDFAGSPPKIEARIIDLSAEV